MNYFNVVPDTNLDGIVQVPTDLTKLGPDTGTLAFDTAHDGAQAYIPLFADDSEALPIHGYIEQGAFGPSVGNVGQLQAPVAYMGTGTPEAYSGSNENGLPYAFNLNTRIQWDMLINIGQDHVKRIEVIRPGGNSVVFDFPWDPTTQSFRSYGTPIGIDANRTYVLRYLDSDGGDEGHNEGWGIMPSSYGLYFDSGIYQTFQSGLLYSVGDINSGQVVGVTVPYGSAFNTGSNAPDPDLSWRYTVTLNWSGGRLDSLDFQTKDPSTTYTIHTQIGYASGTNNIVSLDKSIDGTRQDAFSYDLTDPDTIECDGITVTRTGSLAGGQVTFKTTVTDPSNSGEFAAGTYTSEAVDFNGYGLVTQDSLTLSEDGSATSTATTSYQYLPLGDRYVNGVPEWSKVTKITYPDGSWAGFRYAEDTGWLTEAITPFQSSTWDPSGSEDFIGNRVTVYEYDATQSGNGTSTDPADVGEQPREVSQYVDGVLTGETFTKFGERASEGFEYDPGWMFQFTQSRQALNANSTTWTGAGAWSFTQVDPIATQNWSILGDSIIRMEPLYPETYRTWFGTEVSDQYGNANGFDVLTYSASAAIGAAAETDTSNAQDPFGRSTSDTLADGTTTSSYINDDGSISWFGPASVVETDGSTTKYSYTPLGQVATKTVFAGTDYSIKYSYVYDAAGNVVSQTTQAVKADGTIKSSDPTGDPTSVTNTYAYDAQGRLTKEVDNANGTDATANQTTTYHYSFDGTYNITSVTYVDGSTQVTKAYLDGMTASVSGSAMTPVTYAEGVVAQETPDANKNIETAGSTWTMSSSDGGKSWTRTYTNMLGQVYLIQQSNAGSSAALGQKQPYSDELTTYNLNGEVVKQVGFDGTTTYTISNPMTGQPAAVWVDINGDGKFTPGVDTETVFNPTVPTYPYDPTQKGGIDTDQLSTGGNQDDNSQTWNGGLDSSETVNGMITTTHQSGPSGPGDYTITTTNPDGTKDVQTYTDGLLMVDQQLGADGSEVQKINYGYDSMRRLTSDIVHTGQTSQTGEVDYETDYRYYGDGTQKSSTDPGHSGSTTNNTPNPPAGQPQTTTRADGSTQTRIYDAQGNLQSQTGAGLLTAGYGYDSSGTGSLTSLTTYQSGQLGDTTTSATTTWGYDAVTGQLQFKQYADLSRYTYSYNDLGQLASIVEPGSTTAKFGYDQSGRQTSATYTDPTGIVSSTVLQEDDQGRAVVTLDTNNGKTFTTTDAYTSLGDLQSETFGSAGNASVAYSYYPLSPGVSDPNPQTESPDALQTLTISTPAGQSAQQGYTYESGSKRIQTVTVNGLTITYVYLTESNQLLSITVGGVTTTFTPDKNDPSRLGSMAVIADGQTLYSAGYGYNELDQRTSESVTASESGGTGETETDDYTFTYDTTQADALTNVTDAVTAGGPDLFTSYNLIYNYNYDGVGNFKGNAALGTANLLNQYSNYSYNARGDATNNGVYMITWDAKDRPIEITPDNASIGSLKVDLGYDSQDRWLWKDVYQLTSSGWVYAYSRKAVWDGSNLVGELDASGNLLVQYAWGANGQLAAITDYTQATPHTYVPVIDASGNTAMLIDPLSGAVAANYAYDPYGKLQTASGPEAGLCRFLGKGLYVHAEVPGLMFAQHRITDGKIWLSRDPSGGGLNLYELYNDDPVNKSDVFGTCFVAGTQVLLADGTSRAIEQIEAGTMVLAVPEDAPEASPIACRVLEVYHNLPVPIWEVHVQDGIIRTTAGHPFYVKQRGWVKVHELRAGDRLRTVEGRWIPILRIRGSDHSHLVYNLCVDVTHTYFVRLANTETAVLVHNNSPDLPIERSTKPTDFQSWSRNQQKQWLDGLFNAWSKYIHEAAIKYSVPERLLEIIIINEMIDMPIRKVAHASFSHGPAQIQTDTPVRDGGVDYALLARFLNEGIDKDNPISEAEVEALTKAVGRVSEAYLENPETNIDTAAKLLRGYLDQLATRAQTGKLSGSFLKVIALGAPTSELVVPNDIMSVTLMPSRSLVRAAEAIWNNGPGIMSIVNIPMSSPDALFHANNAEFIVMPALMHYGNSRPREAWQH
jgi:YD repeat-containing protein